MPDLRKSDGGGAGSRERIPPFSFWSCADGDGGVFGVLGIAVVGSLEDDRGLQFAGEGLCWFAPFFA